jgi:hypothetical protein
LNKTSKKPCQRGGAWETHAWWVVRWIRLRAQQNESSGCPMLIRNSNVVHASTLPLTTIKTADVVITDSASFIYDKEKLVLIEWMCDSFAKPLGSLKTRGIYNLGANLFLLTKQ